ncbi:hypothetical protein Tco_0967356 [Tanacetum coccineum]
MRKLEGKWIMKKEMRMISNDGTISEFHGYTSSKEEKEEEEEEEEEEKEEAEEENEESEKKGSKEASEIGSNSESSVMQHPTIKWNRISSPQQGVNLSVRRWKILVRVGFDPNIFI